ncbi:MAG: metallophosphoesterase [Treponema sp.]|nr:metallophosphoesterase [Treponema sp.]
MKKTLVQMVYFPVILSLFLISACPGTGANNSNSGMKTLPDGSQISGIFTKAPVLTFVPGSSDGLIDYSWTAAEGAGGASYDLYVAQGKFTRAQDIINKGSREDSDTGASGVRSMAGVKGKTYSAVVVASKDSSVAYSVTASAMPFQYFSVEPDFVFQTGSNEGEINYSWTLASPGSGLGYSLHIVQGQVNRIAVSDSNRYDTSVSAHNGTFKAGKGEWYSAVLRVTEGSSRVDTPVAQAKTGGAVSLSSDYDLRFGVVGDVHIGYTGRGASSLGYSLEARLAKVLQWYNTLEGVDALAINGDITDNGTAAMWTTYKNTVDTNKGKLQMIAVMGNHDAYPSDKNAATNDFQTYTGQKNLAHYVINGYHLIALTAASGTVTADAAAQGGAIASARAATPCSSGDSIGASVQDWLRTRIDYAKTQAPGRPVFVFLHQPVYKTFYVSDVWYTTSFGSDPMTGWFKDDPQVVIFGSHIHSPNNEPRSIWQGGFTAVNAPSINYIEMETGYLGDNSGGTSNSPYPKIGSTAYGQGFVVSVKGSKVIIDNYDFDLSEGPTPLSNVIKIPQTWEFDVSKPDDFPYTTAKRQTQKTTPVFETAVPSGAILSGITLKQIRETSVEVAFKQARIPEPNPGNEVVHSYRFDFINKNTGSTDKTVKQWSDFMLTPRLQNPVYTQTIGGLASGTDYELRIYAVGSYQNEWNKFYKTSGQADQASSQYLSVEFKTK